MENKRKTKYGMKKNMRSRIVEKKKQKKQKWNVDK